jgi:hypothetical protein
MPFVSDITEIWKPFPITKADFYDLDPGTSYFSTYSCVCAECGLVYAKHRFAEIELGKLYSNYRGEQYNQLRTKYEPNYGRYDSYLANPVEHLPQIERLIETVKPSIKTVLDWGGGDGVNTPFKQTADLVVSYDISRIDKFRVLKEGRAETTTVQKAYDLIVCMHVLEHVNDPKVLVEVLLEFLEPLGVIYFEVPLEIEIDFDFGGYSEGRKKNHWHEHINCFSRSAFERLLEKTDLNLKYLSTHDVSDNFRQFKIIQCIAQKK